MHNEGLRPAPETTDVPKSVHAAVARGLELEADRRHPSMAALLEALASSTVSSRRTMPAVALVVGAGVVGSVWWSAQRSDVQCDSRVQQAAALWSTDAQKAAEEAFGRSSVTYAADTWARASERVTDYVASWGQEAGRVCRGAGPDTAEVDALRNRCLDERLRRLQTVVDALANANDDVVRNAVATTVRLPALADCADVSSLLAAVQPPDEASTRAELAELEAALETASSHKITGDYDEGFRLTQEVLEEARRVAYDPFTADALTQLASFAGRRSEFEVARDAYVEAFELAARARDDRGAADAAADLVYLLGTRLRAHEAAEAWVTVGSTMIARAGQTGQAPEAGLRDSVGNLAFAQGDYERALNEFSTARDIWLALPGEHPIDLAFVYSNIGAVHATLGNYDEAREQHLLALKLREETFGPEHPDVAMSLGNLGVAAYRKGDMEAARDYQERGLAIKRATLPPGHLSLAANAMNLGLVFSRTGEFESAIAMFEQAIEIRTAKLGEEHPEVAGAMSNLAAVYYRQGKLDDAEEVHRSALAIREKALGPDHPLVGNSLQNLGEVLLNDGRSDEAEPILERGLAIFTKAFGPDHESVGLSWVALSRARTENGHLAEALEAARESVANAERSGQEAFGAAKRRIQLGKVRWNMGEDLAAARAIVEAAAATMAETPDREPEEQAKVARWLAEHPLPE